MRSKAQKDFEVAFARIAEERPDALSVLDDAITIQYRKEIAEFAIQKRLPTVFAAKDRVKAGGLMSYGPHYSDMMRRAAALVDKILRGAEPANLPMEQLGPDIDQGQLPTVLAVTVGVLTVANATS
jgi:putative ABC transport system substrate-binding protein